MKANKHTKYLINALEYADNKTYSYGCPYLALADVLGYTTPYNIHHLPQRFDRLSMREMLLTNGIGRHQSHRVYAMIEGGYTLSEIAEELRNIYDYRGVMRVV